MMTAKPIVPTGIRNGFNLMAIAALALTMTTGKARTDGRLRAHYVVAFAGIPIGESTWSFDISDSEYETAAIGKVGGILRIFTDREGSASTQGAVTFDRLQPAYFAAAMSSEDQPGVTMTFDGDAVKDVKADIAPSPDRVPLSAASRKGVVDPLSAVLIPTFNEGLTPDICDRTLAIFDGRRRYDLALSFKRMDKVEAPRGYFGPAVVCKVGFTPIAGHSAHSMLIGYLGNGRDMEIVFAPVIGTRIVAPFSLTVVSMLGDLTVQATEFDGRPVQRAALPAASTMQ